MKILKKHTGPEVKQLTVDELLGGITEALNITNGKISADRLHSVESHLRICIGTLGYKPRETTAADGKVTTSAAELLKQLLACVAETGEITEGAHDHLLQCLTATHSNCAAEVTMKAAPTLKEIPTGHSQQQQQQQQPKPPASVGEELLAMKYPELMKLVESLNADPAIVEKIKVPGNSSKSEVINLILQAKGLPTI